MGSAQKKYTLSKSERLKSKKAIEELFKKGSSFHSGPILLKYLSSDDLENHQILVSVSKRNFKKAVERNLIKRRLREAYRLNKFELSEDPPYFYLGLIYIAKKHLPFIEIEAKLISLLQRLKTL